MGPTTKKLKKTLIFLKDGIKAEQYARSSTGESTCLRSRRLGIRIPPGVPNNAPLAQWTRVVRFERIGREFESLKGCH